MAQDGSKQRKKINIADPNKVKTMLWWWWRCLKAKKKNKMIFLEGSKDPHFGKHFPLGRWPDKILIYFGGIMGLISYSIPQGTSRILVPISKPTLTCTDMNRILYQFSYLWKLTSDALEEFSILKVSSSLLPNMPNVSKVLFKCEMWFYNQKKCKMWRLLWGPT